MEENLANIQERIVTGDLRQEAQVNLIRIVHYLEALNGGEAENPALQAALQSELQWGLNLPRVSELAQGVMNPYSFFESPTARRVAAKVEEALPLPDTSRFSESLALGIRLLTEATQFLVHVDIMRHFGHGQEPTTQDIQRHLNILREEFSEEEQSLPEPLALLHAAMEKKFWPEEEPTSPRLFQFQEQSSNRELSAREAFHEQLPGALDAFQNSLRREQSQTSRITQQAAQKLRAALSTVREGLGTGINMALRPINMIQRPLVEMFVKYLESVPEEQRESRLNRTFFSGLLADLAAIIAAPLATEALTGSEAAATVATYATALLLLPLFSLGQAGSEAGIEPDNEEH